LTIARFTILPSHGSRLTSFQMSRPRVSTKFSILLRSPSRLVSRAADVGCGLVSIMTRQPLQCGARINSYEDGGLQ
jgi:hypothetical protein